MLESPNDIESYLKKRKNYPIFCQIPVGPCLDGPLEFLGWPIMETRTATNEIYLSYSLEEEDEGNTGFVLFIRRLSDNMPLIAKGFSLYHMLLRGKAFMGEIDFEQCCIVLENFPFGFPEESH